MWSSDGMTRTFSSATAGAAGGPAISLPGGTALRAVPHQAPARQGRHGGSLRGRGDRQRAARRAKGPQSRSLGNPACANDFSAKGGSPHRSIIRTPVYIYGRAGRGGPMIAMELVPGGTVEGGSRTAGGPCRRPRSMRPCRSSRAPEAAHAMGVLHRDVKPSNCFIDRVGR